MCPSAGALSSVSADDAGASGAIVHDHLLTGDLVQSRGKKARSGVLPTAGCEWHDDAKGALEGRLLRVGGLGVNGGRNEAYASAELYVFHEIATSFDCARATLTMSGKDGSQLQRSYEHFSLRR